MGELSAPVVVLRVTVRAPDLDAFITRYSRHIAGDRIFIFSKAPQPVGTHVRFNLQLTSGEVLLQGRGTVKRVQNDGGDARHPPGMEVQFKPLDERSATLVDFMIATRAGLTESTVAKAAPIARAVLPAKPPSLPPRPTPLPPLPKLGKQPTPSAPIALPPPPKPPARPTATKLAPVRPPSLSLETAWKSEAPEAAAEAAPTLVGPSPLAAEPSAPLSVLPSAPHALPSAPHALPSLPSLPHEPPSPSASLPPPSLATLSSLPSGPSPIASAPSVPLSPADSSPLSAIVAAAAAEAAAAAHAAGAHDTAAPVEEAPIDPPAMPATSPPPSKPHELGTIIPPTADPSVNVPPVFAESWGGDAPANPFSDVSDGAIEYFVEWSIEQSIGPRALPQARFSDVPMALPGETDAHGIFHPETRRQRLALFGGLFAAGLLVGGGVVGVVMRHPAPAAPLAAAIAPAAASPSAPSAATTPSTNEPPAARPPSSAAGDAELVVTTRPPGASVTIDGAAAGATPLSTKVASGPHEIAVAKERYATTTTTTDAPGKLALDLRRPPATLHVTSTPPAADVVIAGEHHGKTPVDIRLPGFESYDVRVALAGARPWRKTVYLSHASNRLDAALVVGKPAPAPKQPPAQPPRAGRR